MQKQPRGTDRRCRSQSPSDKQPMALLLKSQASFNRNPSAARRPPVSDTPRSAAGEPEGGCEELGAPLPARAGRDSGRAAQRQSKQAPSSPHLLLQTKGRLASLLKGQVCGGDQKPASGCSPPSRRGLEPRPRLPRVSVTLPAQWACSPM